jgi:hypothetical protein
MENQPTGGYQPDGRRRFCRDGVLTAAVCLTFFEGIICYLRNIWITLKNIFEDRASSDSADVRSVSPGRGYRDPIQGI